MAGTGAARAQPADAPGEAPLPPPTGDDAAAPLSHEVPVIRVTARVIDAFGQPVAGAVVTVEAGAAAAGAPIDSPGAVRTNREGKFTIRAPMGATLVIDRSGFDTAIANATGEALDDIVMLKAGSNAETIEIKSEAPPAAQGAEVLDREELQRIPGTGNDIVRALSAMPGVANFQLPLGYSGVVIRGSSPQDSKVLVDDFEIPVLFHNIGFRAIIPAESVQSLDYIPGGFGVEFGRASSGIINVATRPGSDKRSEQAEVSFIDGSLLAQGSIGDKTRYTLGLRRSTIDFILPSILPSDIDLSLTTVPSYYDGQLRIDHEFSSHWNGYLSSIGTNDVFEIQATKQDSPQEAKAKRFYNNTRFLRTTVGANYHDGPWSASLALSGIVQQFIFEAGLYQEIHVSQPQIAPRAEVTRTFDDLGGLGKVVWRLGGEAQVGRADINLALPTEQREGEPPRSYDPKDITEQFHGAFWVPDFAAWTSLAADLDPRIRATLGLRSDVFTRINEAALEPRGEVAIKLPAALTARFSVGAYRRPPEFQSELLHTDLMAEHSTQAIAGLQWDPREGLRIQPSVYYYDRSHLITTNPDGTLGNNGHGKTVGAELLATYRTGPWFGWLSYSYSHSTRVDQPGAEERLFDFDQPHSLNAAVSWRSPSGRWQLGGRFELYSGLPYTPPTGSIYDSDRNIYNPVYGTVNSARAALHHQLDLRVDYIWHSGPLEMMVFADIQNVYMNESVAGYFYSYDYTQTAEFKSIPIIPSFGIRGTL
ncbi:MAG TPA: TonB-dependent receptor [Kofleriaceae bacterium]|nr:TonB-dependent receptor [Kofleriaceae bacterium]